MQLIINRDMALIITEKMEPISNMLKRSTFTL